MKDLLGSFGGHPIPSVLWTMQYQQRFGSILTATPTSSGRSVVLDSLSSELALEENVLRSVKAAWQQICGPEADSEGFLKFEARDGAVDDEEHLT